MCHEYNINNVTEEQLEYLKDFPVWSTYTLGDSSSYRGSNSDCKKNARNWCYSFFIIQNLPMQVM